MGILVKVSSKLKLARQARQYLFTDKLWRGKICPVFAVDATASVKIDEVVATSAISSGASGNGLDGTCTHTVIMLLTSLDILIKINLAMRIEVNLPVNDDFRWASGGRDATLEDKHVASKHLGMDKFHNQDRWDVIDK